MWISKKRYLAEKRSIELKSISNAAHDSAERQQWEEIDALKEELKQLKKQFKKLKGWVKNGY